MKKATVTFPSGWLLSFNVFGVPVKITQQDFVKFATDNGIRSSKLSLNCHQFTLTEKDARLLDPIFLENLKATGLEIELS